MVTYSLKISGLGLAFQISVEGLRGMGRCRGVSKHETLPWGDLLPTVSLSFSRKEIELKGILFYGKHRED